MLFSHTNSPNLSLNVLCLLTGTHSARNLTNASDTDGNSILGYSFFANLKINLVVPSECRDVAAQDVEDS